MSGALETLARSQSRPPLLTGKEQTDVLQARLRAEAEVAASNTTEADPEETAAGGSDAPAYRHCSQRTTTVSEPAVHTGDVQSLVV